jgi:hypothetical protein
MKLIDIDSKATLEDFLTLKKKWPCTVSTEMLFESSSIMFIIMYVYNFLYKS